MSQLFPTFAVYSWIMKHQSYAIIFMVTISLVACDKDRPLGPVSAPSASSLLENPFPNGVIIGKLSTQAADAATICMDKLFCLANQYDGSHVEIIDLSNGSSVRYSLSIPRNAVSVGSSETKVLFAGGYNGDPISRVDIYDASNNMWSAAEVSQPRSLMSVATLNNKVFFAGGIAAGGVPSSRVDIFDASTNSWSTTEISQARSKLVSVVSGNKILFAGGTTSGSSTSTQVDIYDIVTNKWSITNLPDKYGISYSAELNGRVYFTSIADNVDIYNINSDSWEKLKMPEAVSSSQPAISNGKIAFISGYKGWDTMSRKMEVYNPATNNWTTVYLNTSIVNQLTISYKNNIYSIGGITEDYNSSISSIIKFTL